jgi:hypothetical protein
MPPNQVTGSIIGMRNDTCGNPIQLTQLSWQGPDVLLEAD